MNEERGFSTIEALVATLITALVLTLAYETFGGGLLTVRRMEARAKTMTIAKSVAAELELRRAGVGVYEGEGVDGVRWTAEIVPYTADKNRAGDFGEPISFRRGRLVDVRVEAKLGGRTETLHVLQWRADVARQ